MPVSWSMIIKIPETVSDCSTLSKDCNIYVEADKISATFKITPRLFYQHYTFHGIILNHSFPLVYGLTTRKTRATYEEMLRHLIEHAAELNSRFEPQVMLCDFEKPMMLAISALLPSTEIKGCHFHWTQNMWRYVTRDLGLVRQYQNEGRHS